MASPAAVARAIRELLIAELGLDRERVEASPDGAPLFGQGLGIDSIEATALAMVLEARFGIEIPDQELTAENFGSIDRLARLIAARLDEAGAAGEGAPGGGPG